MNFKISHIYDSESAPQIFTEAGDSPVAALRSRLTANAFTEIASGTPKKRQFLVTVNNADRAEAQTSRCTWTAALN